MNASTSGRCKSRRLAGTSALAVALAALVCLAGAAPAAEDDAKTLPPGDTATIIEVITASGAFTTLVSAIDAAELEDTLNGAGPFTLFAPTDDAFDALPEGKLEALLDPANREELRRVITFHVLQGRVPSTDLLASFDVDTLAGEALPLGLRVGGANVTYLDKPCSNGLIHVIDAVLLPPVRTPRGGGAIVSRAITGATEKGVPLFNSGDEAGCARVYRETANALARGGDVTDWHRAMLQRALTTATDDDAAQAWALRAAFDRINVELLFEPRADSPSPAKFPSAGPVGRIVRKSYPQCRIARAEGRRAFWELREHAKANELAATSPLVLTLGDHLATAATAFVYEHPTDGATGAVGNIEVLDMEPVDVLSIGIPGRRNVEGMARAKKVLEARLAADGLTAAGPWRALSYNSPMVPADRQFWELQVPVK